MKLAVSTMPLLFVGSIIILSSLTWLMIWQSIMRVHLKVELFSKTQQACCPQYDCAYEEASFSVIFLAPYSVADCICCDYPSLVSAVSSISASVSALLLPALCLMCAPCILTVVDFSAYGRSDSTRRPSLAALCKRRPGQGGAVVGGGLGLDGLDCSVDDNECYGFLSFFASLGAAGAWGIYGSD